MARNTLGMILAGLGGGLTGYGQEQDRKAQRNEEARRREFSEAVSMLGMGYEPESVAKTRSERVGSALTQAGRVAGTAPSVPGMIGGGALQSALAQAGQVAPRTEMMGGNELEAGGRRYVQRASQTPEAIAGRERSLRTADAIATANREATLQAERDERLGAQKLKELGIQTASAERIAGMRGGTGTTDPEMQWRLKLPAASRKRLEDSETAITQVQALREAVMANPEAVGLKNYAPGAFVDRLDPAGAAVRAQIELIAGEIRNARFGGQLTAQEAQLAMRALPDATQRQDILLSRLESLENFMGSRRAGVYRSFGGGNPPPLTFGGYDDTTESSGATAAERLRSGRY